MIVRRISAIVAIALGLLWMSYTPHAAAHTLKVDGSIGVTMHVDPDDAPLANQNAHIMIGVQDKRAGFSAFSDCTCSLTIKRDDQLITTIPLTGTASEAMANYTFASAGTYTLTVDGQAKEPGRFEDFGVTFTYIIGRGQSTTIYKQSKNVLRSYMPVAIIAGTAIVLLLFFIPVNRRL